MQPANAAFTLKHIVSGILLCFCSLQAAAQPNLPEASAYSEEWLPVYPQVNINGSDSDGLFEFISHNGRLLVNNETLAALGIRVPPEALRQAAVSAVPVSNGGENRHTASGGSTTENETPEETSDGASNGETAADPSAGREALSSSDDGTARKWYAPDSIPGLEMQYDAGRQTLALTAPLAWLNLPLTKIGGRREAAYDVAKAGVAGIFNYDYNITRNSSGDTGQGLLAEARLTAPAGYLSHNHLWSRQNPQTGGSSSESVRLDTYWRTVWEDKGLVLTAGDVLTGRSGNSGGSRIGGLKLERTYSVQPWRSTAPLHSYVGESTLPGTVDLYLNGVKQYGRDIAAGNYEITLPPVIGGSGMAQIVATDILGRTVVVDMPLYGGSGMLAEGLSEWSLEAGYLRRNYGLKSSGYGKKPVGGGMWRHGFTNFLTAQINAEGGGSYRRLGMASSAVLGVLGQLDLSHTQSRIRSKSGRYSSAFFSTQKGAWSFGTGFGRTSGNFADLSAVLDPDAYLDKSSPVRTASASLGWSGNSLGSFTLSYLYNRQGGDTADKVGSLGWNRNFGRRTNIFLNGTRNFNGSRQHSIYGGISLSFDKGYSATLSGQRDNADNSYRASLNKSSHGLGSPSWHLGWQQNRNESANRSHLNGHINYDTQYGDARANVYNSRGDTNWNAGWRGGLVLMRGGLFASRTVNNSFAVVSTGGVGGIPVSLFNNKAGVTNRKGLLLVPDLSAYQKNTLDIDITGLPPDIYAEQGRIEAVPPERSGVAVDFRLNRMRAASITLKDGGGAFVPAGSTIYGEDGTAAAVVGFDGQTFIENLSSGKNRFTVTLPESGGTCRFSADYPADGGGSLPDLGETICEN
ncbi:fimbria/pilus outer membrane usher protein [Neisseria sp.]|uniref:fimbria/pilus outer membrane usher protein n=1 Tax=Neisseria sp. TaxID=192066 RepID=UPI0026DB4FF1|nr:fimbria/pilus outer membrane usher protein [Neisseria sp.]MDO4906647.1 fimbria/pilus outer membrane usher protein [Neisseria sp.]